MRNVLIKPVLNGFIVEVGCHTVVFTSVEDLINNLGKYQEDPRGVEKFYLKNAVNKELLIGMEPTSLRPLSLIPQKGV